MTFWDFALLGISLRRDIFGICLSLDGYSETLAGEEEYGYRVDVQLGADAEKFWGEVAEENLVDDESETTRAELLGYEEGGANC